MFPVDLAVLDVEPAVLVGADSGRVEIDNAFFDTPPAVLVVGNARVRLLDFAVFHTDPDALGVFLDDSFTAGGKCGQRIHRRKDTDQQQRCGEPFGDGPDYSHIVLHLLIFSKKFPTLIVTLLFNKKQHL